MGGFCTVIKNKNLLLIYWKCAITCSLLRTDDCWSFWKHLPAQSMMYYTPDVVHYIVYSDLLASHHNKVYSHLLASHHNKELTVLPAEDKVHSSEY